MERIDVIPGQRYQMKGCASEAMMHIGLEGRTIEVELLVKPNQRPMAQVYQDGQPKSFPILPGEAGFFEDENGYYFYR